MKPSPSALFSLLRARLSLAVAFSSLAGYFLAGGKLALPAAAAFIGVFLLSGAASALNQVQESERDALMARTSGRSIPSGRLTRTAALVAAALLAVAGFLALLAGGGIAPALLGAGNLVWYNLVYTPLKSKTRFALFAGALTGAAPVAIGWTASGAGPASLILAAVLVFMYLWQIPHFLLLALAYGAEYERAGFRCFLTRASGQRGRLVILAWVLLAVASTALFAGLGLVPSLPLLSILAAAGIFEAVVFALAALSPGKISLAFASRSLYVYQLVVLGCLVLSVFLK